MKKRTDPVDVVIKEKKRQYTGEVKRVTLFANAKVVEAQTTSSERFYIVFYRESIIYGEQLQTIEKDTFIDQACKQGITFENGHPLISSLVPSHSINLPNKGKIFTHLQNQYSLKEVAYIATMLDSFLPKEQILNVINKIYFHFRRNGNYLMAFQINHLLPTFSPLLKVSLERLHSQEYSSYNDFYDSSHLSSIYEKDPLYVEFYCFKNRFEPDNYQFLKDNLLKEERLLEVVCLWLENENSQEKLYSVEEYTNHALTFITLTQWMTILIRLDVNVFQVLPTTKRIIEEMLTEGYYEEAIECLLPFIHDLPASFDDLMTELWLQLDHKTIEANLDSFIPLFKHIVQVKGSKESEQIISDLVEKLFVDHKLQTIVDKLAPIRQLLPHSLVIQKISNMVKIVEDPDRMMELGEYFAYFKQFDEAIECFFWEMECEPQNPDPVRQITKMYQQKGMVNEASSYQQLYNQLKAAK